MDIFGLRPNEPPSAESLQPPLALDPTPQEGVLLLRNGEVLEGKILRVGDFYYVAVPNGQLRIRATEVETACRTLLEGYRFKRQNIRLPSAQEHLQLGQWCIRHGLVEEAQQELAEAIRLQPEHPLVPLLRRRIEMARQSPLAASLVMPDSAPKADSYDLDHWVRTLPPAVVEQFTQSVQPILLNNCTASGCHGPGEKSRFCLLKPPSGQSATRRLTQRNLASTFQWIHPKQPLQSPLLTIPLAPHGSAKSPIFGNPQSEAYQRLVRWVLLAASWGAGADAMLKDSSSQTQMASGSGGPSGSAPANSDVATSRPSQLPPAVDSPVQVFHQAGVWQPVPGASPAKAPLLQALVSPPSSPSQQSSSPSTFLPWTVRTNVAGLCPAGSANPGSATHDTFPSHQPDAPHPATNESPVPSNGSMIGSLIAPNGSPSSLPCFPLSPRPRFAPPQRSEPKRGDPMAGQFRPVDPFDPELFNRRHHQAEPSP
ncbi:MAG: hypothetical protein NZ602_16595 [Thermoguttaceae bacterium]|nr:hypothetical protein [Thermoguttaceae bacterium]MDW8038676.1 hypothetical protein [Thermoguttaceae bacterium]